MKEMRGVQDKWDARCGLQDRDAGKEGFKAGEIQERRVQTGGKGNRRYAGQEGCRKVGIQDRWDAGRVCRTGHRRDSGLEGYIKEGSTKGGFSTGGMRNRRDAGWENTGKVGSKNIY